MNSSVTYFSQSLTDCRVLDIFTCVFYFKLQDSLEKIKQPLDASYQHFIDVCEYMYQIMVVFFASSLLQICLARFMQVMR